MSIIILIFAFSMQSINPVFQQADENSTPEASLSSNSYIVDTMAEDGCDNTESEINECEDAVCMGYNEDGNPVGCTLTAALAESGRLGGGTVGFEIDGTFNAMGLSLSPNVNIDGSGFDVTIINQPGFVNPPVMMAAGNNEVKGVKFSCSSGQAGFMVSAMSPVQIGSYDSDGSVRVSGCDTGITISSMEASFTMLNTVLVNNNLGLNLAGSGDFLIEGNYIGTEADGQTANPNTEGIKILPMASNTIFDGNVISGNSQYGIQMVGQVDSEKLRNVRLSGNFIGVAKDSIMAIPNGQSGVEIMGPAVGIIIGEDTDGNGRGNIIANNGHHGIRLMAFEDTESGQSGAPEQVTIINNNINSNDERGIYSSESVILPEVPILNRLEPDTTGLVQDTLYGEATPGDRIDIYFTDAPPDEEGAGEGEMWINTAIADSVGKFKAPVDDLPPAASCSDARAFTATVTDSLGTTSVFADNYHAFGGVVNPQYEEIFLRDVPVQNTYTVLTDWGNTPLDERRMQVRINENDPWKTFTEIPEKFTFDIDMGSTTNGLRASTDNEIELTLEGCHESAQSILYTVPVVEAPSWLETDEVEVLPKDNHIIYRHSWKIPEEPIQASVTIPDDVPYWSGLWGLDETQFEARFDASSLGGETEGQIEGTSQFGLGPYVQIEITSDGTTYLELSPQQLGPFTGDLALGASGSVTFEKGICIPNPFGADIGCVKGSLTGSMDVTYDAPFEYEDEVIWEDGDGEGHPLLNGSVEASVTWPVTISFGVTVDGTAVINFGPPDNLNMNGTGEVVMTPHITAFDENYSTEIELFDFAFGGAAKRPLIFNTEQLQWSDAANEEGVRAAVPPSAAVSGHGTSALAAVVSGENDSRDILVRVREENQTETSLRITGQQGRNLYPTIAFDGNDQLVVVWMHSDEDPPQNLEQIESYAGSFDLWYAVVDPVSGDITEPESLTSDSNADMAPKLVAGDDGSVLLVWASLSGTFGGSTAQPMSFKTTLWSEGEWQSEQTVAEELAGITSWDAAHLDNQTSLLVFTAEEEEQESHSKLMSAARSNGNWEQLSKLVDDERKHAAVHTTYKQSGEAQLIWARDSMLVASLHEQATDPDTVFSIIPDEYNNLSSGELTESNGRLFFGWPESGGPVFITDSADTWTRPVLAEGFEKGSRAISVASIPSAPDSARVLLTSLNYSNNSPVTEISSQKIVLGEGVITSSGDANETEDNTIPDKYALDQNYPNPFNPTTQIPFALPKSGHVHLAVYDILGREVKTLVNKQMEAGRHTVTFNARGLSSGIYLYRIATEEYSETKQFILLK